ncbi:Acyl-[acyl-carrier-protein]--UDP-N-acetylglucosamine O-acyltransferase [Polystyrenella longa]|uniref:Acyl-[acyl-carrier-protein]--UDP-N-acetylglucosamine O-acyltransferase n=1 Tax=Polystyrenella longa TaxID=2528007 RepID=A0A518CQY0_9PLAN|nr:acyl-ACP--UDP-N-acetylglucosamine O-acyltransferase [Polystyrenella longa]QDU81627.1 Acyl-[acyl-carrier-protein]--UDP-N-acetylglucosamine O-acyltransferase [Polystyrenella longa]
MAVHPTAIIHPSAIINPQAQIHAACEIGPHVVIDGPVRIGPGCKLAPSVIVMGETSIGSNCSIHSHAVIGDVPQDHGYDGEMTYCNIGNEVIIREGVTIHRAVTAGQATIIGDRSYLMTNSHVGHDCVLGEDVTLVSGALLGGHVTIGDKAIISGNAAIHQFCRIGTMAMVSGLAKVVQDVPPYLMTDRDGSIVGLNSIGLKRGGYSNEERTELKTLFKLIYRSSMPFYRVADLAHDIALTDAGRLFLAFFNSDSSRGIRKSVQRKKVA